MLFNPGRACAARVTVVAVCVFVFVKSHLTSGVSVRPGNAVTYSAGNEGQKIVAFSLKPMRFGDRGLPPFDGHTYKPIKSKAPLTPEKLGDFDHCWRDNCA